MSDPIEDAVRRGEECAEREWAIEHGEPFPEHLWPQYCRDGYHGEWQEIRSFDSAVTWRTPARCPGCNQTWEAIES